MRYPKLVKTALVLLIIALSVLILKFGKSFLMPLTIAALLSAVLVPITERLERKNWNRVLATLSAVAVIVVFFAAVAGLVGWQASDLAKNSTKFEQEIKSRYKEAQDFVSDKLGIPPEEQEKMIEEQGEKSSSAVSGLVTGILAGTVGALAGILLVLVYVFLMIHFRAHIKRFILRLVADEHRERAREIITRSQRMTGKYLSGYALMIVGLWIMYGIGFSIAGVENAIFFAILCGLLEIIPFIGNIAGTTLTIIMAVVQGGGGTVVLGIVITYAVVQFIQSYLLEPLVVGREVNINPLWTIVGLIAGETIWGIGGMVLAIPVMGVSKIIFDNIGPLKPFGEFLGEDKDEEKE